MSVKFQSSFFAGLSSKEKQKAQDALVRALDGFELLATLIERELDKADHTSARDYDNPSWAYKQADRNGYNRALYKVLTLINPEEIS